MPRVDSKQPVVYYPDNDNNDDELLAPPGSGASSVSSSSSAAKPRQRQQKAQPDPKNAAKKKHVCLTCDRGFTTSGHLARHSRVHTGERNHKCPFPGCETKCSRQDNLQQHYRIHLSPGSRRSSTRTVGTKVARPSIASISIASLSPPDQPPALVQAVTATESADSSPSSLSPTSLAPPPLESAVGRMGMYQHSPPPDSPPALAQATLPPAHQRQHNRGSRSVSPADRFQPPPLSAASQYPPSHHDPHLHYRDQFYPRQGSYSAESEYVGNAYPSSSQHPMEYIVDGHRSHSPVSSSTRHSISHISHPHGYGHSPVQPYQHSPLQGYQHPSHPSQHQHQHQHHSQSQSPLSDGGRRHSSRTPPTLPPSSGPGYGHQYEAGSLGGYSPAQHHSGPGTRYPSPPPILAPIGGRPEHRREPTFDDRRAYLPAPPQMLAHPEYNHHPHHIYQHHGHAQYPPSEKSMGIVGALVQ